MTRERASFLRVGLLLLVGGAIALGLILFIGGQRIRQGERFETYFRESVQGLDVGAPVKYRGVTLGRVTEIGLVNAEYAPEAGGELSTRSYQLVFVRYIIDGSKIGPGVDPDAAVHLGLRARLAVQGLTGLSYIELDFVDPKRFPVSPVPWTPAYAFIPSMPSSLSQVQDAAQQVLGKIQGLDFEGIAGSVTRLLNDLDQQLVQGPAQVALQRLSALLEQVQSTLTAADLPGLTADLRKTSAAARAMIEGEDTRRLLANSALATERLARAAGQLPAVLSTLQATARRADSGTADIQQTLVPVLRDLQVTVENLRETSDLIRRAPAQVLLGSPPARVPAGAR